jgi:hypothetical protein
VVRLARLVLKVRVPSVNLEEVGLRGGARRLDVQIARALLHRPPRGGGLEPPIGVEARALRVVQALHLERVRVALLRVVVRAGRRTGVAQVVAGLRVRLRQGLEVVRLGGDRRASGLGRRYREEARGGGRQGEPHGDAGGGRRAGGRE